VDRRTAMKNVLILLANGKPRGAGSTTGFDHG
jgi:hypothetical protein